MADLPTRINLTVVTRERKIIDVEVDEVVLPAHEGEIGVLPGHTPLLAALRIGQLRYRTGSTIHRLVITWGLAEVLPERVIVLAQKGFLPEEIDATEAEAERTAAEREILDLSSHDPEFNVAHARIEESIAKINVKRLTH